MRQWLGSALVRVMACRLFGANSLPEPLLAYSQIDSCEQNEVKFSEFYHFHSRKCILICRLPKWRSVCPGRDELISWLMTQWRKEPRHLVATVLKFSRNTPSSVTEVLSHWGRDKWPPFPRRHFQMDFLEWKCMNFDWNLTEVCS